MRIVTFSSLAFCAFGVGFKGPVLEQVLEIWRVLFLLGFRDLERPRMVTSMGAVVGGAGTLLVKENLLSMLPAFQWREIVNWGLILRVDGFVAFCFLSCLQTCLFSDFYSVYRGVVGYVVEGWVMKNFIDLFWIFCWTKHALPTDSLPDIKNVFVMTGQYSRRVIALALWSDLYHGRRFPC